MKEHGAETSQPRKGRLALLAIGVPLALGLPMAAYAEPTEEPSSAPTEGVAATPFSSGSESPTPPTANDKERPAIAAPALRPNANPEVSRRSEPNSRPRAASVTTSDSPAIVENAAPPNQSARFGTRGQVVISGAFSTNFGFLNYDDSDAGTSTLNVAPALDYFVWDNLLVGAAASIRYQRATTVFDTESETLGYGAELHLGGNLPLGNVVSIRSHVGFGVWYSSTAFSRTGNGLQTGVGGTTVPVGSDYTQTMVVISGFVPLLVHPVPHPFVGIGPEAFRDISNNVETANSKQSHKRTYLGVSSVVGGWF